MPNEVSIPKAAQLLHDARRVMVIGTSGAGKSTLAARIAKTFELEHIPLDRDMRWLPGWKLRDREEQRSLHEAYCARDRWVIDGTGVSLFPERLARADLVIWLRPSRWAALRGVAWRVLTGYGKTRRDMAPGCPEKIPDREFLSYIWHFESRQSPRIIEALDLHGPDVPVVILRRRSKADVLLGLARSSFGASGHAPDRNWRSRVNKG